MNISNTTSFPGEEEEEEGGEGRLPMSTWKVLMLTRRTVSERPFHNAKIE